MNDIKRGCCQLQRNIHYKNLNISTSVLADKTGYGIIVFDRNLVIACFDINYCPMCGKKLESEVKEDG